MPKSFEKKALPKTICPFKFEHKRVENDGVCTAVDVDGWIDEYGDAYIACKQMIKRENCAAYKYKFEYESCVGEDVCPIMKK